LECAANEVFAGVKSVGNGSAGQPGTAATPNLLCPCFHHSFLASFAVAFIARLSNAKGKVGSFELILWKRIQA
jgi:hypothetical protein